MIRVRPRFMRVFVSGPMGVGKSTVVHAVAARLGLEAVDLDARVEARAGMAISEIFARSGEAAFRALERECARALLDEDQIVVALGGGTVADESTRRAMLGAGLLVTLDAPVDVLIKRVGARGAGRPMLTGDVASRLRALLAERRGVYAEAHGRVDATRSVDDVAASIVALVREEPVAVALGERSYAVEIAAGCRARWHERTKGFSGRVFVADRNTERYLPGAGHADASVVLEPGEANKDIRAVERIWDAGLSLGGDRGACVVAVGGGVVGDLAGFAAATLLRGVAFGQVPTSLLAMVDSSVGGKTGFDRPQGKNLVGAFHQPRFVLCDVETLETLPREERIAGLAEVVKSAWLEGEADVVALEEDVDALVAGDPGATERAIRRSVRTKARVVAADEQEAGLRMCLNLGHTLGHALEAAAGFGGLRHGEAVALGLIAAMRIGRRLGDAGTDAEPRMVRLLSRLGLPTDLDRRIDARVLSFVGADKKRAGARVGFVVPGEPGRHRVVPLGLDDLSALCAPT